MPGGVATRLVACRRTSNAPGSRPDVARANRHRPSARSSTLHCCLSRANAQIWPKKTGSNLCILIFVCDRSFYIRFRHAAGQRPHRRVRISRCRLRTRGKVAARRRPITRKSATCLSVSEASKVAARPIPHPPRRGWAARSAPDRSANAPRQLHAAGNDGESLSSVSQFARLTDGPPRLSPAVRAAAPAVHSVSWRR